MHRNPSRPMSPHLTIWKWGPHMLVSILNRITGAGLSVVGGIVLVWWLVAAASSKEAYDSFTGWATSWIGIVIGVGLTWAFFQHTVGGLRHLVMDIGAGFELRTNKFWANLAIVIPIFLTALFWFVIVAVKS
jgi:succinate dehydrogenase / fumarate reductase cytochrome b subunit